MEAFLTALCPEYAIFKTRAPEGEIFLSGPPGDELKTPATAQSAVAGVCHGLNAGPQSSRSRVMWGTMVVVKVSSGWEVSQWLNWTGISISLSTTTA